MVSSASSPEESDPKERRAPLEQRLDVELQQAREASDQRLRDWTYLAPGPDKPTDWEFAFELSSSDEELRTLFTHFELSPTNPFDWRALVDALASALARKRRWTLLSKMILAVDLCEYRDKQPSWDTRQAAEAMRSNERYSHIGSIERMMALVREQDDIARFSQDDYSVRLAKHYGDEFSNALVRRQNGGVLPWDDKDWRWR